MQDTKQPQTQEQKPPTFRPANNIYKVPINDISFLECLDESPAMGYCETTTLSEGRDEDFARFNLTQYPGFFKNWKKLTPEQRKRIQPFVLRNNEEIEKVLYCEKRFKNDRGDYVCGVPTNENMEPDPDALNGEFGGNCCIVGNYNYPTMPFCPYYKQLVELGLEQI